MTSHPFESVQAPVPGVIEIRVQSIQQLFNSMDPTPFPDRDLDDAAEEFIVGWAMEHPTRAPLEVRVHMNDRPEPAMETHIQEDIRHFFAYKREMATRRFRQLMGRGRTTLVIGLLFLVGCLGAADFVLRFGTSPIYHIAKESFVIAGWVAMWKPMEIFLYDWWPLRRERNVYDRLSRATVHIVPGQS